MSERRLHGSPLAPGVLSSVEIFHQLTGTARWTCVGDRFWRNPRCGTLAGRRSVLCIRQTKRENHHPKRSVMYQGSPSPSSRQSRCPRCHSSCATPLCATPFQRGLMVHLALERATHNRRVGAGIRSALPRIGRAMFCKTEK